MADRETEARGIVNSNSQPIGLKWGMRLTVFTVAVLMSVAATASRADTVADCGRFFLKYNPETKQMECVGGKRKRAPGRGASVETLARDVQRSLSQLGRVVNQAEQLLRAEKLSQEAAQRVRTLLTEARNRTREIQRKSRELAQAQKTRTQQLATEQRQVFQAQEQLARQLEQKQQALTQQLLAEQRSRTQELLR
ncbi:MAG: hypothetical protein RH946_00245 [Rhodospirillales bacterium]